VPEFVAYFVIAFAVYWLYRSLSMSVLAVMGHFRIKAASSFNWIADLKKNFPKKWNSIQHIIIIPTYKEPLETLERTLDGLSKQSYPQKNLHIMLSFEEREGKDADEKAKILIKKYGEVFGNLWTTKHPDIEGEVKGKSSNTSWGARIAKKHLIDDQKFDLDFVTISSEDADALFHKDYFANVSFEFLSEKNPYNKIWQGAVVFYNNIWKVPPPIRVLASMFSVIQIHILMRSDRLINFSTYTTSLKHVVEIDFWDTNVIPEDYRLFFKSYFAKKGDFEVKPIFLPIYSDAAESGTWWETFVNQYEQLKRWAWGVSDDAYIIKQYINATEIPFWEKTIRVSKTVEDHFLWPVNWFAITIGALLPPLLNKDFSRTIIGKTLPQVTSGILTLCLLALLVMIILNYRLRPKKAKGRIPVLGFIFEALEFVTLPVVGFFFTALPGIDAHTRLMLGKYIEYKVTEKVTPQKIL